MDNQSIDHKAKPYVLLACFIFALLLVFAQWDAGREASDDPVVLKTTETSDGCTYDLVRTKEGLHFVVPHEESGRCGEIEIVTNP